MRVNFKCCSLPLFPQSVPLSTTHTQRQNDDFILPEWPSHAFCTSTWLHLLIWSTDASWQDGRFGNHYLLAGRRNPAEESSYVCQGEGLKIPRRHRLLHTWSPYLLDKEQQCLRGLFTNTWRTQHCFNSTRRRPPLTSLSWRGPSTPHRWAMASRRGVAGSPQALLHTFLCVCAPCGLFLYWHRHLLQKAEMAAG